MKSKTLFIIGAGFSKNLGGITTEEIGKALDIICQTDKKLIHRLDAINKEILRNKLPFYLQKDLERTLLILLDGDGANSLREALKKQENVIKFLLKKYKKYFPKGQIDYFEYYLRDSYRKFDYLAFRSFYLDWKDSLGSKDKNNFSLTRFLSLLDKAYEENISVPTKEIFGFPEKVKENIIYYNRPYRLKKALDFFRYITFKLFKIILANKPDERMVKVYYHFFRDLIKNNIKNPENLESITDRRKYLFPFEFLTFNWDPFLPFILLKANWKINNFLIKNSLKFDIIPQIYVDFNWNIPIVRLNKGTKKYKNGSKIYDEILPSEDTAFFVNKHTRKSWLHNSNIESNLFLEFIKFYAIHGLFNLRYCPYCNNLFFITPIKIKELEFTTYEGLRDLFLSDPIPSVHDMQIVATKYKNTLLYEAYMKGRPDEILCPHCEHPTYFEDTPLSIQTIFKTEEIFFLKHMKRTVFNKIFHEYKHVIVIGYSFPEDDLINSYIMELYSSSTKNPSKGIDYVTIISYDTKFQKKTWYYIEEIENLNVKPLGINFDVVKRLFPNSKIRLSFLGWPNILNRISIEEIIKFS